MILSFAAAAAAVAHTVDAKLMQQQNARAMNMQWANSITECRGRKSAAIKFAVAANDLFQAVLLLSFD